MMARKPTVSGRPAPKGPTPMPTMPTRPMPATKPTVSGAPAPKGPTPMPTRPMPMKKGGSVKSSASSRADGCITKGKTKGMMVKMKSGGKC